jgi:CRISPR-associated protein Csm1
MPHNKHAVILAALLHDIGKFKWRSTALQPGCDHETFSEEIFNEFIAHKKCVEPISDEVRNLIKHHDNPILSVINRADHLDEDSNRKEEENTDGRRPLISVLSQIELKRKLPRGIYYYKPKKLSMDDIFPEKMDSDITSPWKAEPEEMRKLHEALYQQFVSELRLLPDTHLESYIDTLLFLYEKYLCYVTSAAYKNVPDISLFDHNKTVAALASCYNDSSIFSHSL